MSIKNKIILGITGSLFLSLSILFSASAIEAATINLAPSNKTYSVGDLINVKVLVASNTSLNAVSAEIVYPVNLLSLRSIPRNSSIINLWAQEPSFSNSKGVAGFEGVILEGYTGRAGTLVTLVFKAQAEGKAIIKFSNASILANDGYGTELFTGSGQSVLTIKAKAPVAEKEEKDEGEEKTIEIKPKEIVIEIAEEAVEKIEQIEESNNLPERSLLITIIVILLAIIILIIFYVIYYIRKLKNHLKKKLQKAESSISKDFKSLEKGTIKEIEALSKKTGKKSSKQSKLASLFKIEKEIKDTETAISKEIEDIEEEL